MKSLSQLQTLRSKLAKLANPSREKVSQSFFKTGKGEYGEGDVFLGLSVPQSREIAKKYLTIPSFEIRKLIVSKVHEERLIALLILVYRYQKGSKLERKAIYDFYLTESKYVNNWDLVDLSADKIVGAQLLNKTAQNQRRVLVWLAKSSNLWERRIAMVATYQFIKNNQLDRTLEIAQILLFDKHDLIQKAVGWMLREVGKRDQARLEGFLQTHYKQMPRTALRYAIERFPQALRNSYLRGEI